MSLFDVQVLGPPLFKNPLGLDPARYVDENKRLAVNPFVGEGGSKAESFELAGPREHLFFNPAKARAVILSCGGLCPGINAVIRILVLQLWQRYGCRQIFGARFGFHGLSRQGMDELQELTPDDVSMIHETGGSILGSSRGHPDVGEMLQSLVDHRVDIVFVIGGDGTLRGARDLAGEAKRRGAKIAIVAVPKTIDNDIPFVKRSFGFETAVGIACQSLQAAFIEATGYRRGVGIVRLMGRHSGYIAASAVLATSQADFCLVPEVPFALEGRTGLFALVAQALQRKGHVLIVVAEGAGQEFFKEEKGLDPSGNIKLGNTGLYLSTQVDAYFAAQNNPVTVKYIDPSYLIRSAAANPADQLFCVRLAQAAVHAALAGKTGLVIGYWHGTMTHVPFEALRDKRQAIKADGDLWSNVLETTGQPDRIGV